jgi:CheY-like chemotaxis protein
MNVGPVLVVDDDADIRIALCELLEHEGYRTATAANGQEALRLLTSGERPCIILLDLMMPVMDGWQFLEQQRKDPALATIPVVVVTAAGNRIGERLEGITILEKPFKLADVLVSVERNCERPPG